MSEELKYLRSTALTFASVTNGVALGVGIYQTMQRSGEQYFYVLNLCSFALLVFFWWRYVNFLSYYVPSSSIEQYCADFAIAAVGIGAVFFFNHPDRWALCYIIVFILVFLKHVRLAATLNPVAYRRRKDYSYVRNRIRRNIRLRRYPVFVAIFLVYWLGYHVTGNNKAWVVGFAVGILVILFIFAWKHNQDFYDAAKKVKKGSPMKKG